MSMSEEEKTLRLLKSVVADMEPEHQQAVNKCADAIRAAVAEAGPYGVIAVGLVGAEISSTLP